MRDFIFQNGPWVSILVASGVFILAAWIVLYMIKIGREDFSRMEVPVEFEDHKGSRNSERADGDQPSRWMTSTDRSDHSKTT